MALAEFLGVKAAPAVAGFVGSVISLRFLQGLTRWQAIAAVATGTAFSIYATPVALYWAGAPPELEKGVAFLLGLCAMGLVPAIVRAAEKWGPRKQ